MASSLAFRRLTLRYCVGEGHYQGRRESEIVMADINSWRERLLARIAELDELAAQNDAARATVILDQQSVGRLSRMDALQGQQMAKETWRRRQLERARIAAALKRLDDGEFGWCAECGAEIPERRLEIDPTAHLCVDCAR